MDTLQTTSKLGDENKHTASSVLSKLSSLKDTENW